MNTGMGDAHNLAWKLAVAHRGGGSGDRDADRDADRGESGLLDADLDADLGTYCLERRPVAAGNAGLSLRNYDRTLAVARAVGLDARHPQFVVGAMEALIPWFVPMSAKSRFFQTLVDLAMKPLEIFERGKDNLLVRLACGRIQKLLDGGRGLPLLFPKYELGYKYYKYSKGKYSKGGGGGGEEKFAGTAGIRDDGSEDAALYEGRIESGCRLPHVVFLEGRSGNGGGEGGEVSSVVLGGRGGSLANLVLVRDGVGAEEVERLKARVSRAKVVRIRRQPAGQRHGREKAEKAEGEVKGKGGVQKSSESTESTGDNDTSPPGMLLVDSAGEWSTLAAKSGVDFWREEEGAAVVVRPDGHVKEIIGESW